MSQITTLESYSRLIGQAGSECYLQRAAGDHNHANVAGQPGEVVDLEESSPDIPAIYGQLLASCKFSVLRVVLRRRLKEPCCRC